MHENYEVGRGKYRGPGGETEFERLAYILDLVSRTHQCFPLLKLTVSFNNKTVQASQKEHRGGHLLNTGLKSLEMEYCYKSN